MKRSLASPAETSANHSPSPHGRDARVFGQFIYSMRSHDYWIPRRDCFDREAECIAARTQWHAVARRQAVRTPTFYVYLRVLLLLGGGGGGEVVFALYPQILAVSRVDRLRYARAVLADRRALFDRFVGESNAWQRRQYQTDMVRQKNQSVEDVRKRDDVKTAMLVNRSGVHRVTRKGAPS